MSDFDNNVIALMVLQEENKQLKEKLEKIEQIINSEVDPNICNNVGDVRKVQAIREVLENG